MQAIAFDLSEAENHARYDRLFESCAQAFIQQSASWAEIIRDLSPDRPIFLLALDGDEPVGGLPLYLYESEPGPIITSVPHAGPLGGVFCLPGLDPDPIYAALLAKADAVARDNRCLALSIITNPMADDIDHYRRHLHPTVTFENFTQVVPLEVAVRDGQFCLPDNDERNPGRTIRKAEAAGLVPVLATEDQQFEAWYAVHRQRHGELGLQPLSESLLHRIWRDLGRENKAFLQLVMSGEEIATGCLFIHHRDVCDAFIMSMASKFSKAAPNYLLTKAALLEMARRGIKTFNWQSSARRGDGVYNFKKQWGSREERYFFVTRTYCPDATILALGKEGARRHYPDHFLVPFAAFDGGSIAGAYAK
jgi:hypothetical protein